ncbi:hypothetical protein MA16_Dca016108 [Dendrobium catenatum]|uniref:Coenzyme Q-binding protein COQ10 START domain-containing protein n=1 Tax=Dendrobium catenatum TaxID=906689 RepID=A0A2I0WI36_9ASPA|nr:hypothetical protein MA16_Dca016108 [Dendrobium catenatum]
MRACGSPNPSCRLLSPHLRPQKAPGILPSPSWTLSTCPRVLFSASVSGGSPQSNQQLQWRLQSHAKRTEHDKDEEEERPVHYEVDVVSWRERRIRAKVLVHADVDTVWTVLTDYERLADFIPNLIYSGRIPCPHPGRIWLEQRGLQRALYWHIEARVVLDLQEFTKLDLSKGLLLAPGFRKSRKIQDFRNPGFRSNRRNFPSIPDFTCLKSCPQDNGRELQFTMVDGDFMKFEGKWSIKTGPRSSTTILTYEVSVIPRFNLPAIFLERIIRSDLPVNLRSVACRAEKCIEDGQISPLQENGVSSSLPPTIPSRTMNFSGDLWETDIMPSEMLKETYAGHAFVSVRSSRNNDFNSKCGVFGKVCRLDSRSCMADEVHLRRFDGLLENGGSHRCVVASITVKAPVHEVWNVLTAYETLPEIVPNLAISKILLRDNSKVRILQDVVGRHVNGAKWSTKQRGTHTVHFLGAVRLIKIARAICAMHGQWHKAQMEGCKGLLYMVLHARVVLDLHEKHEEEIKFEQVEGDFDLFQGKWILEQLGDQHTLLKYSVESTMYNDTFLSEAIVEAVVYEDLPSNLCAIRDFVETRVTVMSDTPNKAVSPAEDDVYMTENLLKENISRVSSSNVLKHRPKVPGLQKDLNILKAEIVRFISRYGQEGFMPMRKQLRLHGRVDIEKAVTRLGGFRKIASLMNLSLAYKQRKPKGYWDSLENLQEEICRFQRNWGMDPTYMPSRKSFERAGRYDIARALEKWGGLQEVSRLLSLEVRHPRRKVDRDGDNQLDSKASKEIVDQRTTSHKPIISQDTQKWLTKLKNLDINWVE